MLIMTAPKSPNGYDITTTINVNLQDIAESALQKV